MQYVSDCCLTPLQQFFQLQISQREHVNFQCCFMYDRRYNNLIKINPNEVLFNYDKYDYNTDRFHDYNIDRFHDYNTDRFHDYNTDRFHDYTTDRFQFLISNRMNIYETFICHNFIEYLYVMKC